jgi:hypothetical protein
MTTCSALRSKAWCTLVISRWSCLGAHHTLHPNVLYSSSGALKRSKLEKLEPSISYETFVEDLDPGDSFTTTLTELLVRVRPCFPLLHTLIANYGHRCRRWPSAVNDKWLTVD